MNSKIFNEKNLTDEQMDGNVLRVKAFIINPQNEILVALSNGGVQLIGGHVEENEEEKQTLIREIKEEAGIEVSYEEISDAFYEVKHYINNYYNTGKNIIAIMHYYIVKTDKAPDFEKVHLTEQEKGYAFSLKQIPFDSFKEFLIEFLNNGKEINRIIAAETLEAFNNIK